MRNKDVAESQRGVGGLEDKIKHGRKKRLEEEEGESHEVINIYRKSTDRMLRGCKKKGTEN